MKRFLESRLQRAVLMATLAVQKIAKSPLPSAALIALAVWIAYHMWPVSGWGKLVWIALTYAAYDWARQRLVFGAWLRGLVAGLIRPAATRKATSSLCSSATVALTAFPRGC